MKYQDYRAGNDKEMEYGERGNRISTPLEDSKKGDVKAIKALKLGFMVLFLA